MPVKKPRLPPAPPVDPATCAQRAEEEAILERARAILEQRLHHDHDALTSPDVTRDYLRLRIGHLPHEVFGVIFLDNRHRVIQLAELFRGTIDGSSVHPREVVKESLLVNAAAVVFYHNHPSGVAEPSQADLRITQRLKEALALIDIRVLDHLIVSVGGSVSLAERGLV